MQWNSQRSRQIGGVASLVAFVIFGLVFGVTQILKSRKGSMAISIQQADIRDGGTISGVVKIKPRKNLSAQGLTLLLVCQESWEEIRTGSDGYDETRTEWRERHSQTMTLGKTMELRAGTDQEIPFELQLPASIPKSEVARPRRASTSYGRRSRRTRSRSSGRLRWKLSANLDLDGIDLDANYSF